MTGFGRAECLRNERRFKVELKSVNHRYGDFTIKLPRFMNPYEDRIRKRLGVDITRGKVDVWVNFESFSKRDVNVRINEAFADAYADAIRDLCVRYGITNNFSVNPATLELLARHPDIITFEKMDDFADENTQVELWETALEALEQALAQFNAMREAEGDALTRDIVQKADNIRALASKITERSPVVQQEHRDKLRERVTEILNNHNQTVDESRLLTEIALMADRGCIDEELTRLDSHLAQLASILAEGGAVGRKLDFLVQELNREINTIGSKSTDPELSKLVVAVKSEIEKIREQVQNIE